ncbi:uncharacterized protein IWZ02DRAFT_161955 [Phyllosticta citriasiana]|uniref:uncharacterized protein n=1 Tax=Phyllosticta citriasiana TaxID=595635 RepID=UPI0030FD9E21
MSLRLPPPSFLHAVQEFESVAKKSSTAVAEEFRQLVHEAKRQKINNIKSYLSADSLRCFALTTALVGRTRCFVEDLGKSSWELNDTALLDAFGASALLSVDFLTALRNFARLGKDVPWAQAKLALDKARRARLETNARGIHKRDWCTSDVKGAMIACDIVDTAQSTVSRRKGKSTKTHEQDAQDTALPSPASDSTQTPSKSDGDDTNLDNHEDIDHNNDTNDTDMDMDLGDETANDTQPDASAPDPSAAGRDGDDDIRVDAVDSADGDGWADAQSDSGSEPDVEMGRRDLSALSESPLGEPIDAYLDDYDFGHGETPQKLPRTPTADDSPSCNRIKAGKAEEHGFQDEKESKNCRDQALESVKTPSQVQRRFGSDSESSSAPMKRQSDFILFKEPPTKQRRVCSESESESAAALPKRRRIGGNLRFPQLFQSPTLSPIIEEDPNYKTRAGPSLAGPNYTDKLPDFLQEAHLSANVSVVRRRRPPNPPNPPASDVKHPGGQEGALPAQKPQNDEQNLSKSKSPRGASCHPGSISDDSGEGATDAPKWPPPYTEQIVQQLGPAKQLSHRSIWALVRLFQPLDHVCIVDVPLPSPNQTWEAWASQLHILRRESNSMVLAPLHLAQRKHWVVLSLDLELCHASLFDSVSDDGTRKDVEVVAKAIVRALGLDWDEGKWKYQRNPKAPQQTNDYDCGIYVIITCLYLIARTDLPADIDGACWRHVLSRALGLQPSSLYSSLVPDVPWEGLNGQGAKHVVEAAQALKKRSRNLAEATMHVEEMVRVLQLALRRLHNSQDGAEETRRDVSMREKLVQEMAHLPRSRASDTQVLQQLQESLGAAQKQLQREESGADRLRTSIEVLESLCRWLDEQRVELRQLRQRADADVARAVAMVEEEYKIYREFLQ